MRPRSNLHPHNGYTFTEPDGSIHRADGWPGVIARVRLYRKRNGIPEGNVESDVFKQVCEREPTLCGSGGDAEYYKELRVASLKVRVLKWLSALLRDIQANPNCFVDDATAKARANVCATCPLNKPLADGCAPCKQAVSELRRSILGPHRSIDARLHNCTILGTDVAVNIYLDEVATGIGELPDFCWRKIKKL
jgi:hypothetical protein